MEVKHHVYLPFCVFGSCFRTLVVILFQIFIPHSLIPTHAIHSQSDFEHPHVSHSHSGFEHPHASHCHSVSGIPIPVIPIQVSNIPIPVIPFQVWNILMSFTSTQVSTTLSRVIPKHFSSQSHSGFEHPHSGLSVSLSVSFSLSFTITPVVNVVTTVLCVAYWHVD